jgi:oxygen-dependent protoporphyrinogen oxidase
VSRLAVVGGGISGLAAAHGAIDAWRGPGTLSVVVFESNGEAGGKARTLRRDGWLVECGPTGYLEPEPALDRLTAIAGLEHSRLPADAAAARRFLVRGGVLREVHPHPLRFARSGLLGPGGLLRLAAEPFVPRRRDTGDESVWEFARRRLGREAADRLIAPMVLGVHAGDAKTLSLRSAFPRMAELEAEHGSLVRALIALKRSKARSGGPAGPAGTLVSFRGGLQELPRRLAAHDALEVRFHRPVRGLEPEASGWRVLTEADPPFSAGAVVLAGEAWSMAPLLRTVAPEAAVGLAGIPYPPVAVVALGFGGEALARAPRGFGALLPRGEGYRMLGCLWDTHVFPGRSPEGTLLVRAMLGGTVDPEAARLPADALLRLARDEVVRLLDLPGEPEFTEVLVWPRAIPQYTLGHETRAASVERALELRPGLFLAGNSLHGIAFGKAAASGYTQGERAARYLSPHPASAPA